MNERLEAEIYINVLLRTTYLISENLGYSSLS